MHWQLSLIWLNLQISNVQEDNSAEFASATLELMEKLCDVLGLNLDKKEEILDEEIENLDCRTSGSKKEQRFRKSR